MEADTAENVNGCSSWATRPRSSSSGNSSDNIIGTPRRYTRKRHSAVSAPGWGSSDVTSPLAPSRTSATRRRSATACSGATAARYDAEALAPSRSNRRRPDRSPSSAIAAVSSRSFHDVDCASMVRSNSSRSALAAIVGRRTPTVTRASELVPTNDSNVRCSAPYAPATISSSCDGSSAVKRLRGKYTSTVVHNPTGSGTSITRTRRRSCSPTISRTSAATSDADSSSIMSRGRLSSVVRAARP